MSKRRTQVGDFCAKGHKIVDENVYLYTSNGRKGAVMCRICHNEREKERMKAYRQTEGYRASQQRKLKKAREKTMLERYERILSAELESGAAKYTGLNYLKLGKRAQRAWEPLAEKFDTAKGKCYKEPLMYIDYDEDYPPSKQMSYELCKGCPLLVECGRFAAAYKPVIGVWGGERWANGQVVK